MMREALPNAAEYVSKIYARYRDIDLANAISRETMYFDIGVLCGRVELLERTLRLHGIKSPENANDAETV